MANGKIKADTLEHSTAGSLDTQYVVNGSVKSWMSLNGADTIAIRNSLNISSVTDSGTGDYLHSFTNNFDAADYNQQNNGDASDGVNCGASITQTYSSSSSRSRYYNASYTVFDAVLASVANNGDLA